MDMTDVIVANYHKHNLDMLVCVGGGGTQKNAFRLMQHGLNVMTLPKTIDNDVARTDVTFGYDTALGIATEAIDRLHSTAHSNHRIIVVEVMGHNTGWLALGAGVAGGADVILIPEIPYDVDKVAHGDLVAGQADGARRAIIEGRARSVYASLAGWSAKPVRRQGCSGAAPLRKIGGEGAWGRSLALHQTSEVCGDFRSLPWSVCLCGASSPPAQRGYCGGSTGSSDTTAGG